MYVKEIIICIIVICVVVILLVCRYNFNRSGISDSDNSVDELKTGLDESREINRESREITEDIRKYNRDAGSGIDEALNILREAKDRNNT